MSLFKEQKLAFFKPGQLLNPEPGKRTSEAVSPSESANKFNADENLLAQKQMQTPVKDTISSVKESVTGTIPAVLAIPQKALDITTNVVSAPIELATKIVSKTVAIPTKIATNLVTNTAGLAFNVARHAYDIAVKVPFSVLLVGSNYVGRVIAKPSEYAVVGREKASSAIDTVSSKIEGIGTSIRNRVTALKIPGASK